MAVQLTGDLVLEAVIRFTSVGFYLATALIIFKVRATLCRTVGTLAYISKAFHVILHFPPVMVLVGVFSKPIMVTATMGAALTWLFAIQLYTDHSRFDRRRLLPVILVLVIAVTATFSSASVARALWLLHSFVTVALMTHLLVVLASSWQNDLIERRRLIATPVFVLSALYSISLGFIQTVQVFDNVPRHPSLMGAFVLLVLSILAVLVFGQFGGVLFGDEPDHKAPAYAETSKRSTSEPLSSSDARLVTSLEELLRVEKLYRMPELRISKLALQLHVPEHRLRQLLNYSLGYRNFNAYIGHWRITEAKEALNDPEQLGVPISTIAIDSGYQSLAPFNRAFRGETGMTPSEYRAEAQMRWERPLDSAKKT